MISIIYHYTDIRGFKDYEIGGAFRTHGKMMHAYRTSIGKSERKRHLEDVVVNRRIILKRILENSVPFSSH